MSEAVSTAEKKEGTYVTLEEAAEIFGVTRRYINDLCEKGVLGERCGKHWVITREEAIRVAKLPRNPVGRPSKGGL